jgi:hypothetical protein
MTRGTQTIARVLQYFTFNGGNYEVHLSGSLYYVTLSPHTPIAVAAQSKA